MYPAVALPASFSAPVAWPRSRPEARLAAGLIGAGRIGSALLEPLRTAQARLARDTGVPPPVSAIAASRRMWPDRDDPELNARQGAQTWRPTDLDISAAHVRGEGGHAMPVDCSASEKMVAHYAGWLEAGLHIVTPNKLAISGPSPRWRAIHSVPVALRDQPSANFRRDVNELEAPMATHLTAACAQGGMLRHVARLDRTGCASVKLEVLPSTHPFAQSQRTDNVARFSTRRRCHNPLRVQNPGAGPEVIAAGVFADLLRIAETLEPIA